MESEVSKATNEIHLLDQTIKHFESDLHLATSLADKVALDGQRILQQSMKNYSEITKRIALGDESGLEDISSLNAELASARVNLLVQAAVESTSALKSKLPVRFGLEISIHF